MPLFGNIFQLPLVAPGAFPDQMGHMVPAKSSGSTKGSLPSMTYWADLQMEVSRGHPNWIPCLYFSLSFFANDVFFSPSSVHEPCRRGHFVVRGEVARISTSKENNVIILPGGRSVVVGTCRWSGQQSMVILFKERVWSAHIQDNLKPPPNWNEPSWAVQASD